jgi:hypothetical protein
VRAGGARARGPYARGRARAGDRRRWDDALLAGFAAALVLLAARAAAAGLGGAVVAPVRPWTVALQVPLLALYARAALRPAFAPGVRLAWACVAAAALCWWAGDVLYVLAVPGPAADACFLLRYPLYAAAALALPARRAPGARAGSGSTPPWSC